MEKEIHIACIVVYAESTRFDSIKSCVSEVPYAEIHADDAQGKMIVTLETDSTKRTLDTMDAIRALSGVLNVALVYQHAEPASALDLEVSQ